MRRNYTLGDLLRAIREEKGIRQAVLCKGLCDQSTISRIENGSPVQNRLLLNVLVQRLGETPDHFITIVTPEEIKYYEWQSEVYDALNKGSCEGIRSLLQQEIAKDRSCHKELQEQFYLYMKGYAEKDMLQMKEALAITMPDIIEGISNVPCMGTTEMFLLLLYVEQCLICEAESEGVTALRECLMYLESKFSEEERVKLYPQAVLLLCKYGKISPNEKLINCERAIQLLREQLNTSYMPMLLEEVVEVLEVLQKPEVDVYRNYLWAFRELYKLCGLDYRNECSRIFCMNQEMYKLSDIICRSRKEKELSREGASENICDVLTMGRLERGERGTKLGKYHKLRDKLEIPYEEIYCARLVTNNYGCIRIGEEIQRMVRQGQHEGIQEKLTWLRENLDLNISKNRQYVEMEEQAIGEIGVQRSKEILQITIPNWTEEYSLHLYTSTEIQLVHHVAKAYWQRMEYEKADKVIRAMWKNVDIHDHSITMLAKELIPVLATWTRCLNYMNRKEEALEKCKLGLSTILSVGHGEKLSFFVTEKCQILYKNLALSTENEDEIINSYKQAYYLSVLYGRDDLAKICRIFLEKYQVTV